MKQKLMVIISLVLIVMLFAGCGAKNEAPATSTPTPVETTPEPTPEPTPSPEPTPITPPVGCIVRGTWNGNTFSNEWAGIRFTCPDDWKAQSDEELAEQMQIDPSIMSNSVVDIKDIVTFVDLCAESTEEKGRIIVLYHVLTNNGADYTAETYLNEIDNELKKELIMSGYGFSSNSAVPVKLSGNEFYRFNVTIADTYSQYYYARRVGDYMISIIANDYTMAGSYIFESYFN